MSARRRARRTHERMRSGSRSAAEFAIPLSIAAGRHYRAAPVRTQSINERTRILTARRLVPALAAAAIAVAVAATGCSASSSSNTGSAGGTSSSGGTVDVYSSLPMQGSSSAQTIPMVNGIKLALADADGKAGKFTVNYTALDDSTAAAGKWDPTQTAANARKAASDPNAVYYVGEFNSGASEVSIPILNQAGIAQVSPASIYVGLTTKLPGSAS